MQSGRLLLSSTPGSTLAPASSSVFSWRFFAAAPGFASSCFRLSSLKMPTTSCASSVSS